MVLKREANRPWSPGVIYPALTFLEEVDYARSEQGNTRNAFLLTVAVAVACGSLVNQEIPTGATSLAVQ